MSRVVDEYFDGGRHILVQRIPPEKVHRCGDIHSLCEHRGNSEHAPPARLAPFLAGIVLTLLTIVALIVWGAASNAGESAVGGKMKWIGGQPSRYAATHHGDRQPTFKQGVTLRLVKGNRHTWVRVTDTCDGSACAALDTSPATWHRLGVSTSQGIVKIRIECGRKGNKPMRKCLVGEDRRLGRWLE